MQFKTCLKCKESLPDSSFYKDKRRKDGLYSWCRDCHKKAITPWRLKNPDKVKRYSKKSKKNAGEKKRQLVDELKSVPCSDCGIEFPPYVMDFDHVGKKSFNVSSMVHHPGTTEEQILLEAKRCEVVCANCHRMRTFNVPPEDCSFCRNSSTGTCRRHKST
jgi:hypothetical protein